MNKATPINNGHEEGSQGGPELFDAVMNVIDKSQNGSENASEHSAPAHISRNDNVSDNSSNTESSNAVINRAMRSSSGAKDVVSSIEADEQAEKIIDDLIKRQHAKKTFLQKLTDEARDPILAIILFIIFQSGTVTELLSKNLGKFLNNSSGELGYLGVASKAVLFALVYYILKKLLA
jgi:membrane-bound ClpP family serine protease